MLSAFRLRQWLTAWLLIVIPVMVLASHHKHVKHRHWTNKYDHHFKKYSKRYFGIQFSWQWFKAQGIAESGLNPKAESKVGAKGIMQILPSTYEEITEKNAHLGAIEDAKWNIAAGIYYDRQIYLKWKQRQIPSTERLSFTFASYNAGFSRTLRALNKAKRKEQEEVNSWHKLAKYTPGATREYVKRINELMIY